MPSLFNTLNLPQALLENLDKLGYTSMTPIQEKALPLILSNRDLIAQAKTGSGKTAAFGIGTLLNIDPKVFKPQALIMTPTRELALQVYEELKSLAKFIPNFKITSLTGGIPKRVQITALKHGTHIVIGTPGRLIDLLSTQSLNLENLKTLVLDEADKMVDMGFMEQINTIIEQTPENRQTLLFSATFPDKIKKISDDFMQQPGHIKVDTTHQKSTIQSHFYRINRANKMEALSTCLYSFKPNSALIFANTKVEVNDIVNQLNNLGFSASGLHGDLEQSERGEVLLKFENQSTLILVATDVASRGLDIKDLECVINYELPYDPEVYTHRIGRTGRAGEKGISISFVNDKSQRILEDYLDEDINLDRIQDLDIKQQFIQKPPMVTLCISGGKRDKLSKGDILGALTGTIGLNGKDIGKIHIHPIRTYIAIKQEV
ncbi:MAG: ATP-dependent RNA helicase DbpA, partial [Pseudomonadota bacterium]